jgi:hypothetical protein
MKGVERDEDNRMMKVREWEIARDPWQMVRTG